MLSNFLEGSESLFGSDVRTELRAQENIRTSVMLQKGNLVSNTRGVTSGVSARVCKNGVYGFASIPELSKEAANKVLMEATKNAQFLAMHTSASDSYKGVYTNKTISPDREIVTTAQKDIIDYCREVDEYIVKNCPNLASRGVRYSSDSMDKIILTSDAASGHVVYPRSYIYINATATGADGAPIDHYDVVGGVGSFDDYFKDFSKIQETVDKVYEEVMKKKEGVYAKAGLRDVILGGILPGMLAHEAVGHTVEADLVKGGSVAGPFLNKEVGSELVSMVDFANTAFGQQTPLPVYLDDEGIVAKDQVLIEKGILKGYMNNRDSANEYNMTPNGNARAWDFSDEPLIRMRNTAVLPGQSKLEDMIASIDDGYYLLGTNNGQADLTGEFMFGVSFGYEIKHGKLGKAILDTTISGVAFEMLKTVDMVSNDFTWSSSGFCGKKQIMPCGLGGPAIKCKVTMGGR